MKKPTLEDCFFIALIYLDEFIKRVLISPFKLYIMYDYWSHNRKVAADAKYAKENPPVLPNISDESI